MILSNYEDKVTQLFGLVHLCGLGVHKQQITIILITSRFLVWVICLSTRSLILSSMNNLKKNRLIQIDFKATMRCSYFVIDFFYRVNATREHGKASVCRTGELYYRIMCHGLMIHGALLAPNNIRIKTKQQINIHSNNKKIIIK